MLRDKSAKKQNESKYKGLMPSAVSCTNDVGACDAAEAAAADFKANRCAS